MTRAAAFKEPVKSLKPNVKSDSSLPPDNQKSGKLLGLLSLSSLNILTVISI